MSVPISERALVQRINRKLAQDNSKLYTARTGSRTADNVGRYYWVDGTNTVVRQDCDLEALGRELGVLKAHEVLG